jgi:hypothetical protein
MDERFARAMAEGFDFGGEAIVLGSPRLGDELLPDVRVRLPLAMANRHGLIAGATGTGKTKTLQLMAGQLSDAGVPCFVADAKGAVTGISRPGDPAKVAERCVT